MDEAILVKQRAYFHAGKTRPLRARLDALAGLARFLEQEEAAILEALRADLGKPAIEAYAAELGMVQAELRYARSRAEFWMQPERARTPWASWPGQSEIRREPRGAVLVLSPWNYPVFLSLAPAVGALACGNTVVLKPSELAPATEALLASRLGKFLPPELFTVVTGDATAAKALLAEPWGLVVFTGGGSTGKAVMAQAAQTLSPVLLELGGQNPTVVAPDADLAVSARRILWGKGFNAGQTCLAPDHLWAHRSVKEALVAELAETAKSFYGEAMLSNAQYGRLVNARHFAKVKGLLDAGVAAGGKVLLGGRSDEAALKMELTLLDCPDDRNPALADENFGPLLPLLTWDDEATLIQSLRRRAAPLALYVFTGKKALVERLASAMPSGAVVQNGVFSQILSPEMPFGGVGGSGFGRYRGEANRDMFTVERPFIRRSTTPDVRVAYPPIRLAIKTFKRLMPWMMG